jgi:hypothetical protein
MDDGLSVLNFDRRGIDLQHPLGGDLGIDPAHMNASYGHTGRIIISLAAVADQGNDNQHDRNGEDGDGYSA